MNYRSLYYVFTGIVAGTMLVVTGCASTIVTPDILESRTAHALGLDAKAFQITDRVDEGSTTRYMVQANGNKRYNCYIKGMPSLTGKVVSAAMCTGVTDQNGVKPTVPCNALLKAAGRCQ